MVLGGSVYRKKSFEPISPFLGHTVDLDFFYQTVTKIWDPDLCHLILEQYSVARKRRGSMSIPMIISYDNNDGAWFSNVIILETWGTL